MNSAENNTFHHVAVLILISAHTGETRKQRGPEPLAIRGCCAIPSPPGLRTMQNTILLSFPSNFMALSGVCDCAQWEAPGQSLRWHKRGLFH